MRNYIRIKLRAQLKTRMHGFVLLQSNKSAVSLMKRDDSSAFSGSVVCIVMEQTKAKAFRSNEDFPVRFSLMECIYVYVNVK
jgi:hypothetical protein